MMNIIKTLTINGTQIEIRKAKTSNVFSKHPFSYGYNFYGISGGSGNYLGSDFSQAGTVVCFVNQGTYGTPKCLFQDLRKRFS